MATKNGREKTKVIVYNENYEMPTLKMPDRHRHWDDGLAKEYVLAKARWAQESWDEYAQRSQFIANLFEDAVLRPQRMYDSDMELLAQELAAKHMAGKSIKYTMVSVGRQNGKEWLRNRVNEILKEAGCTDVF